MSAIVASKRTPAGSGTSLRSAMTARVQRTTISSESFQFEGGARNRNAGMSARLASSMDREARFLARGHARDTLPPPFVTKFLSARERPALEQRPPIVAYI